MGVPLNHPSIPKQVLSRQFLLNSYYSYGHFLVITGSFYGIIHWGYCNSVLIAGKGPQQCQNCKHL